MHLRAISSLVLAFATQASAVLVGLQWQDTPAAQISNPIAPNTPIKLEFYIQAGNSSITQVRTDAMAVIVNAWADPACQIPISNELFQVSMTPRLGGFTQYIANNNAALNGLQYAAMAGPMTTLPESKFVAMDIAIKYTHVQAPGTRFYLTIDRELNGPPVESASIIVDPTGNDYMTTDSIWDARPGYADTRAAFWAFGDWGNRGWSRFEDGIEHGQLTPNPIILDTPEPASLALLALGGMALLRRR